MAASISEWTRMEQEQDDENVSLVSLTSEYCHEAAFLIQTRFRDHLARQVPPAWPVDVAQVQQNEATRNTRVSKQDRNTIVIVLALSALGAVLLSAFALALGGELVVPTPPLRTPMDSSDVMVDAAAGCVAGAAAGASVGLFFPWAMPIEAAFGCSVGTMLGGVQSALRVL